MNYLQILKEHKLKATPQRMAILKVLDKHTHPNIDELYEEIKQDYPSVSLATVYKNVSTLKEIGLVAEVNMPNSKMRYDIYLEPHIHVICNNCQNVLDIPRCDDLNLYQKSIEKNLQNHISSLSIVAHVNTCKSCV